MGKQISVRATGSQFGGTICQKAADHIDQLEVIVSQKSVVFLQGV